MFTCGLPPLLLSTALVGLAFTGSIGMTFLVLACALPQFNNWWPFFLLAFYLVAPFPVVISRRYGDASGNSTPCQEMAVFLTAAIVISAFGLPIVLARAPLALPVIQWGAAGLVITANIIVFLTILGFFVAFDNDDVDYSMW
uniref:EOG090X0J87 n=1 Tax=Evadne anonyx TaxID=141404 RepID=A0A9N6WQR2_9CRUS|nr:EOG090X0J87 [Evadne anonyx]